MKGEGGQALIEEPAKVETSGKGEGAQCEPGAHV